MLGDAGTQQHRPPGVCPGQPALYRPAPRRSRWPVLYGYTALGRKIEWMRTNPLVCLECEEVTTDRVLASLIVFGHYEELPHIPGNEDARRVADRLFQRHPMWWEPATVPLGGHERRPPIVFRIHIDSFTGRRTIYEPGPLEREAQPLESGQPPWLTRMWRRLRRSGGGDGKRGPVWRVVASEHHGGCRPTRPIGRSSARTRAARQRRHSRLT